MDKQNQAIIAYRRITLCTLSRRVETAIIAYRRITLCTLSRRVETAIINRKIITDNLILHFEMYRNSEMHTCSLPKLLSVKTNKSSIIFFNLKTRFN